jgi:hypothetical protein
MSRKGGVCPGGEGVCLGGEGVCPGGEEYVQEGKEYVQEGRSKAANIKGAERPLPPRSPHQTTGGERKKVQPIFFRGTFTCSLNISIYFSTVQYMKVKFMRRLAVKLLLSCAIP